MYIFTSIIASSVWLLLKEKTTFSFYFALDHFNSLFCYAMRVHCQKMIFTHTDEIDQGNFHHRSIDIKDKLSV